MKVTFEIWSKMCVCVCVCEREKTRYMWSSHLRLSQMVFVNWPCNIIQLGLIKTLYREEREKRKREMRRRKNQRETTCAVLSYTSQGEGI